MDPIVQLFSWDILGLYGSNHIVYKEGSEARREINKYTHGHMTR